MTNSPTELHEDDWKPKPGNYFIHSGTWLIGKGPLRKHGVVSKISDNHNGGTVVIEWYPDSVEFISARAFRAELRNGMIRIDPEQHPYPSVDWEVTGA